jgi:hypothetical protein
MNNSQIDCTFHVVPKIERNVAGWRCMGPTQIVRGTFVPVFREFLEPGEDHISGEEMPLRAITKGIRTGLRNGEAMQRCFDRIPKEAREFILVFPEVWADTNGCRGVFCSTWRSYRWCLDFGSLKDPFYPNFRLVEALWLPEKL